MKQSSFLKFILLAAAAAGSARAYDEYSSSCVRPGGRAAKAWPEPPCDFKNQAWCTAPGSAYPWHAVRRFVHENQGLMRRMYGDMRQISVLRAEYESNDVLYPGDGTDFQLIRDGVTKRYRPSVTESSSTLSPRRATSTTKPISANSTTTTSTTTTSTSTTTSTTTPSPPTTENVTSESTEDTTEGSTTLAPSTILEDNEQVTTEELDDQIAEETELEYEESEEEEEDEEEEAKQKLQPQVLKRGINACPVKEEVVAPFWANNTRGEVLALLNLYPFEQYVHWEKCAEENQQMFCRDGCRCEQQYRLHRLLAYDPRNECRGIFSDWFKFPSCCVCKCYDIPPEFRLTSRSPRRGTAKLAKKVTVKKARTNEPANERVQIKQLVPIKILNDAVPINGLDDGVPINGLERREDNGEMRADLQAVVHHDRSGRQFSESATLGPIDAATPHFYYQPPGFMIRRPRNV